MKGLHKRKFAEVERNPSHSPAASSSPFSNSSPGESDGEGRDFPPPSVPSKSANHFFQIMQTSSLSARLFHQVFHRSVSYQNTAALLTE